MQRVISRAPWNQFAMIAGPQLKLVSTATQSRDRILVGIRSDETRHKFITKAEIILEEAIAICHAEEAAAQTQLGMEHTRSYSSKL